MAMIGRKVIIGETSGGFGSSANKATLPASLQSIVSTTNLPRSRYRKPIILDCCGTRDKGRSQENGNVGAGTGLQWREGWFKLAGGILEHRIAVSSRRITT
jgi:hypothetical protein